MSDVAERFWSKVNKTESCWLWTASKGRGYGKFTIHHGKEIGAHRWAYEAIVGPIPAGLVLDHLCRVRHCVNPAHLEPVTQRENLRRSPIVIATVKSQWTHCKRGHELSGENLRIAARGYRYCRACGRQRSLDRKARIRAERRAA